MDNPGERCNRVAVTNSEAKILAEVSTPTTTRRCVSFCDNGRNSINSEAYSKPRITPRHPAVCGGCVATGNRNTDSDCVIHNVCNDSDLGHVDNLGNDEILASEQNHTNDEAGNHFVEGSSGNGRNPNSDGNTGNDRYSINDRNPGNDLNARNDGNPPDNDWHGINDRNPPDNDLNGRNNGNPPGNDLDARNDGDPGNEDTDCSHYVNSMVCNDPSKSCKVLTSKDMSSAASSIADNKFTNFGEKVSRRCSGEIENLERPLNSRGQAAHSVTFQGPVPQPATDVSNGFKSQAEEQTLPSHPAAQDAYVVRQTRLSAALQRLSGANPEQHHNNKTTSQSRPVSSEGGWATSADTASQRNHYSLDKINARDASMLATNAWGRRPSSNEPRDHLGLPLNRRNGTQPRHRSNSSPSGHKTTHVEEKQNDQTRKFPPMKTSMSPERSILKKPTSKSASPEMGSAGALKSAPKSGPTLSTPHLNRQRQASTPAVPNKKTVGAVQSTQSSEPSLSTLHYTRQRQALAKNRQLGTIPGYNTPLPAMQGNISYPPAEPGHSIQYVSSTTTHAPGSHEDVRVSTVNLEPGKREDRIVSHEVGCTEEQRKATLKHALSLMKADAAPAPRTVERPNRRKANTFERQKNNRDQNIDTQTTTAVTVNESSRSKSAIPILTFPEKMAQSKERNSTNSSKKAARKVRNTKQKILTNSAEIKIDGAEKSAKPPPPSIYPQSNQQQGLPPTPTPLTVHRMQETPPEETHPQPHGLQRTPSKVSQPQQGNRKSIPSPGAAKPPPSAKTRKTSPSARTMKFSISQCNSPPKKVTSPPKKIKYLPLVKKTSKVPSPKNEDNMESPKSSSVKFDGKNLSPKSEGKPANVQRKPPPSGGPNKVGHNTRTLLGSANVTKINSCGQKRRQPPGKSPNRTSKEVKYLPFRKQKDKEPPLNTDNTQVPSDRVRSRIPELHKKDMSPSLDGHSNYGPGRVSAEPRQEPEAATLFQEILSSLNALPERSPVDHGVLHDIQEHQKPTDNAKGDSLPPGQYYVSDSSNLYLKEPSLSKLCLKENDEGVDKLAETAPGCDHSDFSRPSSDTVNELLGCRLSDATNYRIDQTRPVQKEPVVAFQLSPQRFAAYRNRHKEPKRIEFSKDDCQTWNNSDSNVVVFSKKERHRRKDCVGRGGHHSPDCVGKGGRHSPDYVGKGGRQFPDFVGNDRRHSPDCMSKGERHSPDCDGNRGQYSPGDVGKGGRHSTECDGNDRRQSPDSVGKGGQQSPGGVGKGGRQSPGSVGKGGRQSPGGVGKGGRHSPDCVGKGGWQSLDSSSCDDTSEDEGSAHSGHDTTYPRAHSHLQYAKDGDKRHAGGNRGYGDSYHDLYGKRCHKRYPHKEHSVEMSLERRRASENHHSQTGNRSLTRSTKLVKRNPSQFVYNCFADEEDEEEFQTKVDNELREVVACLYRSHYEMLVQVTNIREEFLRIKQSFNSAPLARAPLTATLDTRVNGTLLDYFVLVGVMLIQFLLQFFLVKKKVMSF